ncbi:MAG: hypothetical protein ACM3PP_00880 [Candidatus Saccharibacteria bacterium]
MSENNDNIEKMRELIQKKKDKSASQGSVKRGPEDFYGGAKAPGKKKEKKGGLPPK